MPPLLTASSKEKRFSLKTREDLYKYQNSIADKIKDAPACAFWLKMSARKTISVLTALADLFNEFRIGKALVISPLKVAQSTWPVEIKSWEHTKDLTYTVLHGKDRKNFLKEETDIHIINRENIPWLVETLKNKWPYDTVIIDESTSFKSHRAKRFKALKKVRHLIERIYELTGTPLPNGLLDLWAQIYLLDRGERLGRTFTGYRDRYFESDYRGYNWTLRKGAKKEIYHKIKDIVFTVKDIPNMQEPVPNYIYLELPDDLRAQYRYMEKNFLLELESSCVEILNAAALSNKLLQFCSGAVYTDKKGNWEEVHTLKLEALKKLIGMGENIFIGYNFISDKTRILNYLPDVTSIDEKDSVERWNRGELKGLLAHPGSAGHGLNLQFGGHHACHFSMVWSSEYYRQFSMRLPRDGQEHEVINHHIIIKDTIEETVLKSQEGKEATERGLVEALKRDIKERIG